MICGRLDEFKQRSVVRVAGLYAVAGWAVFQVVNTMFPALDMPRWTVSLAALAVPRRLPGRDRPRLVLRDHPGRHQASPRATGAASAAAGSAGSTG